MAKRYVEDLVSHRLDKLKKRAMSTSRGKGIKKFRQQIEREKNESYEATLKSMSNKEKNTIDRNTEALTVYCDRMGTALALELQVSLGVFLNDVLGGEENRERYREVARYVNERSNRRLWEKTE